MKLRYIFAALLCLCLLIAPAAAAGGSGTAANPYIIETAAELQSMANDLSAYYRLGNDIDLSGVAWTPIGTSSAGFHGELDGNGYTISNLDLTATTTGSGLFGAITSGATIKDLTLEDCSVVSSYQECAVLVGRIAMSSSTDETATLQNINLVRCFITSSTHNCGVLCGLIYSSYVTIKDCTVINCGIEGTASQNIGLFIAQISSTHVDMTNCHINNSHVKASNHNVGLFMGQGYGSGVDITFTSCTTNNCIVESTGSSSIGGLCGSLYNGPSVSAVNCIINNNIIKGTENIGSLFGLCGGSGSVVNAEDCTVTGCSIIATNYAGGIIGHVNANSQGVFSDCTVTDCSIIATNYAAGVCPAYS